MAAALVAAVGGYRLGFLGRVTSWVALAPGFYVAIRLLPAVIRRLGNHSPGVLVGVAVAILVGGALLGQGFGLVVGSRLHRALPFGPWRRVDRVVGAAAGAVGVIVVLWLLSRRWPPSPAGRPGRPPDPHLPAGCRGTSRRRPTGAGAEAVDRQRRPPGVRRAAAGHAGRDRLPPPALWRQAVTSEVRGVHGQGRGPGVRPRSYEGSGFAVAPDLIVTNAHVVAGEGRGAHQRDAAFRSASCRRRSSCSIPAGTWPCSTSRARGDAPSGRAGPHRSQRRGVRPPRRPESGGGQPGVGRAHERGGRAGSLRSAHDQARRARAGRRAWPTATRAGPW